MDRIIIVPPNRTVLLRPRDEGWEVVLTCEGIVSAQAVWCLQEVWCWGDVEVTCGGCNKCFLEEHHEQGVTG